MNLRPPMYREKSLAPCLGTIGPIVRIREQINVDDTVGLVAKTKIGVGPGMPGEGWATDG